MNVRRIYRLYRREGVMVRRLKRRRITRERIIVERGKPEVLRCGNGRSSLVELINLGRTAWMTEVRDCWEDESETKSHEPEHPRLDTLKAVLDENPGG